MTDDKDTTENIDERIAPEAPAEAAGVETGKRPRRTALIGGIALACVALAALVVGLNLDAISSFGSSGALQTTEQSDTASSKAQSGGTDTERKAKDAAESESEDEKSEADAVSEARDAADSSASSEREGSSGGSAGGAAASAGSAAESVPEPEPEPAPAPQPATITVSVSVSSSVVGNPVSGGANPTFAQGATAYDALLATGLSVSASYGTFGLYVQAIGGLAERQYEGMSGWKYAVNGVEPGTSSANYQLRDGDFVSWYYVL